MDSINLLDGDFYAGDPYPTYAWLRENAPVYYDEGRNVWGISRYADVIAVEKDAKRYCSGQGSRPRIPADSSMINNDDPLHNLKRRLISPRFTPRAVRQHEGHVRRLVSGLIDSVAPSGEAEVVEDLAAPLPSMLICEWLGFPHEMWFRCKWWSEATMLAGGQHAADGSMAFADSPDAVAAGIDFGEQFAQLVAERRKSPRDDLASIWAHADVDGRKLTDEEIVSEGLLVLDGGAETTRAVIATSVLNLIAFPDQRQRLIDDPSGITIAVEEFIRYATPVLNMKRTVVEDHEFRGQQLREGDELVLLYGSANRDPAQFPDPDRFDVARRPNQHLSFGFGTHFCVGASVARMELRVMFEELLRRMPDFRLAPGAEPRFVPSAFARSPDAVPIVFTPESA